MRKLLIAANPDILCAQLHDALHKDFQIFTCADGRTALGLLNSEKPDALILDLNLPELDGLMVLSDAHHRPPVILALTTIIQPYIVQVAAELGIGYIFLKPCSTRAIVSRITDMVQKQQESPSPAG